MNKKEILENEINNILTELKRAKRELTNQQEIVNTLIAELRVAREEHARLESMGVPMIRAIRTPLNP